MRDEGQGMNLIIAAFKDVRAFDGYDVARRLCSMFEIVCTKHKSACLGMHLLKGASICVTSY